MITSTTLRAATDLTRIFQRLILNESTRQTLMALPIFPEYQSDFLRNGFIWTTGLWVGDTQASSYLPESFAAALHLPRTISRRLRHGHSQRPTRKQLSDNCHRGVVGDQLSLQTGYV